jgi:hypothetical protein
MMRLGRRGLNKALRLAALIIFTLILLRPPTARANPTDQLDPIYLDFIKAELQNDYVAEDTTVAEEYRKMEPFKVHFLEIPRDRLNVELSGEREDLVRQHLLFMKNGREYVRFYIHPASEHLYQPLINEFGFSGFYWALPTASTRSVLAWDPTRPELKPVFLKLSLAQLQDGMGRVIPGWEIRRSVRLTKLNGEDKRNPQAREIAPDVSLIDEFAGAYIKPEEKLGSYVDKEQGTIFDHGFILRDASFIEESRGKILRPLFWLFIKQNGGEPKIVELAKKAGLPFYEYIEQNFFRPFIRKNLPFMLKKGIVPQIHGQNVVIAFNPQTWEIEHIYHRDLGSMKTDYRLRWLSGLSIAHLRSDLADKDFGLSWGAELIEQYHLDYLHDWNFRLAYRKNLKTFVQGYDWNWTYSIVRKVLESETDRLLGTHDGDYGSSTPGSAGNTNKKIVGYIDHTVPATLTTVTYRPIEIAESVRNYVAQRTAENQSAVFPAAWAATMNADTRTSLRTVGYTFTPYGLVYNEKKSGLDETRIAFFESAEALHGHLQAFGRMTCEALFKSP